MKQRFALVFTLIIVLIIGLPVVASLVYMRTQNAGSKAASSFVTPAPEPTAAPTAAPTETPTPTPTPEPEEETLPEEVPAPEQIPLPKYDEYLSVNPYVSGWLSIDGTKIDDPVVYTPGSQNYFLHRDLDGTPLEKGTFFIAVNWREGFYNTLIYGHNMKDGSGFGSLAKYADESYGAAHPVISFDTLYDEKDYELLAAFYSQIDEDELETEDDREDKDAAIFAEAIARKAAEGVTVTADELTVSDLDLTRDYGDEDIYREEKDEDNGRFRYYYFNDLADRDDYEYFIKNVKERALYDTGVDARYGDELLTLSTCSYHVKNGRFIVVAVHHKD